MSGTQSQAQQQVRLVALVDASDEHVEPKLSDLAASGWRLRRDPSAFDVIQVDQPFGESDVISKVVAKVQAELTAAGIQPAAVTAHLVAPATGEVDPSGGYAVNLVGSPDIDAISKLFGAAVAGGAPAPTDSKTSPDSGGPPPPLASGKDESKPGAKGEVAKTTTAPSTLADPAATIAAAIPAFPDPQPLWAYIEKAERSDLARGLVSNLHTSRTDFARRSEWVVAPEMVLLDACPRAQREDLAMNMLKVRAALTKADEDTRNATAALAEKDVQLADKRVAFAGQGVALAGETLEHMKKWRSIANIGLAVLSFTTAFSMAAAGYVLLYLAPHEEVSDAAIPVIIFVLALFAISPAVLLLRERPLEGLDKWSPPGATSDSKDSASGTADPKASSSADSAAKPLANDASKQT